MIYTFKGETAQDGESPASGVIIDRQGNLYGATEYGGTGNCLLLGSKAGCGTVFELSPPKQKGGAWTETILYSFPTAEQGYIPIGNLVFDSMGNLYGATMFGGTKGTTCDAFYGGQCGVVFELSPPAIKGGEWTETVLHNFGGGEDGANPNGGLTLSRNEVIYGSTGWGGNAGCAGAGCGTIYALSRKGTSWSEKILHRFTDGYDGAGPNGGLVLDAKGSLYGTTGIGGNALGYGVIFRLTAGADGHWSETILHYFTGGNDGQNPQAGLVSGKARDLYRTSIAGPLNAGVMFRLRPNAELGVDDPAWSFYVLYTFRGPPDCGHPPGALILAGSGIVFGTGAGGNAAEGCVFKAWP